MAQITSQSPNQTSQLAQQIYQEIKPMLGHKAVIIALEGQLGSGKTTFTKALAKAMGITEPIVSPTFTLHKDYTQLDHIDAWRLEQADELTALGLAKMVEAKRVVVVEWAEKVKDLLLNLTSHAEVIWIKFDYGQAENDRVVTYDHIGN